MSNIEILILNNGLVVTMRGILFLIGIGIGALSYAEESSSHWQEQVERNECKQLFSMMRQIICDQYNVLSKYKYQIESEEWSWIEKAYDDSNIDIDDVCETQAPSQWILYARSLGADMTYLNVIVAQYDEDLIESKAQRARTEKPCE